MSGLGVKARARVRARVRARAKFRVLGLLWWSG